jgi:hypothetical protein
MSYRGPGSQGVQRGPIARCPARSGSTSGEAGEPYDENRIWVKLGLGPAPEQPDPSRPSRRAVSIPPPQGPVDMVSHVSSRPDPDLS